MLSTTTTASGAFLMLMVSILSKETSANFSYDPNSKFGPDNWDDSKIEVDPFLADLTDKDEIQCEDGDEQSPIDLVPNSECVDDHQIHNRRGKHNWDTLNFEVLPHALRVHFPEFDDDLKDEPRAKVDWPPSSDFSNLSDREPAVYMDVKIPSEHYMYGKQYPGELHIGHRYTNKIVYIGVMIDVKGNETNTQFDQFIKEWEEIAWQRKFNCENGDGDNKASYSRKHPILLPNEMKSIWGKEGKRSDFDLFSMLPTVYYFGYEGSYTAPPCVERVHWRILDLPIYISQEQYLRLQSLFMDSLTEDCAKNEVAFQGRVNRPLQTHKNKNDVWHCSAKYWKPKHAVKWCDKWDEDYHGYNKLRKIGVCAQK